MDFIPVHRATEIILENSTSFGIEEVAFEQSLGRVLAENILADRDLPPYDRVTMDGIAFQGEHYNQGQRIFEIEQIQYAGEPQKTLKNPKACIEIMTGASLPVNTDTVIRYEDISTSGGNATLKNDLLVFRNIHRKGFDRKQSDVLLTTGKELKSPDLAVLATAGKTMVKVNKLPKVAVITSGDELLDVNQKPLPHQIRKSNIYGISALLQPYAAEIDQFHLKDNLDESIELLHSILKNYDAIVLSGGVSAGKKDFLPEALKIAGVKKHFHKIQQRPGKPMWFGTKAKVCVFALPGNPVSSFMCAVRYALPWFRKSIGLHSQTNMAVLKENITFKPPLSYFMQVTLSQENGVILATPLEGGGSGDLANLSLADAFMELPKQDPLEYQKGGLFPIWPF